MIVSALGSMGLRAKVDGRNDMTTVEGGKKFRGRHSMRANRPSCTTERSSSTTSTLEILQLLLTVDPAKFTSKRDFPPFATA